MYARSTSLLVVTLALACAAGARADGDARAQALLRDGSGPTASYYLVFCDFDAGICQCVDPGRCGASGNTQSYQRGPANTAVADLYRPMETQTAQFTMPLVKVWEMPHCPIPQIPVDVDPLDTLPQTDMAPREGDCHESGDHHLDNGHFWAVVAECEGGGGGGDGEGPYVVECASWGYGCTSNDYYVRDESQGCSSSSQHSGMLSCPYVGSDDGQTYDFNVPD